MVIVADRNGNELRELAFSSYDYEVGTQENSFLITILRSEYVNIPQGARIYIPGTEYGGLFRELQTDTKEGTISPGGMTWRGMMQKKIIEPEAGNDYATDTGEVNAIIKRRVEAAFPGLFIGTDNYTGVTVSNYQYRRYCTLEAGLTAMLKSVGYRLNLAYSQVDRAVIVSAVPIANYSNSIVFSADQQANYSVKMQSDGVNHLICLGKGNLAERTVYNLYADQFGNISTTQYYFNENEVAEVYDSSGSELADLISGGRQRLKEVMNKNTFEITIEPESELAVGDIVGGIDYLSHMKMSAPIIGKIVKWENGFQTIDYKLADEVKASVF